jgi:hypothetical protein
MSAVEGGCRMIVRKHLVAVIGVPLGLATALLGQKAPAIYTIKGDSS